MPLPEKALIGQIRRMAGSVRKKHADKSARPTPSILAGIGDDCAVLRLPAGCDLLVTTDFTLEGTHFRRDWHPPEVVGHRSLVRGLSDIAAMGGEPIAAFLSLALPRNLPQTWVERFMRGLLRLAKKFSITLAGGDTSESPDGILADIIVVGTAPKGKAVLRSGARPGDRIFVSGELGGSAAALVQLWATHAARRHPERSRSSGGARDLARIGTAAHARMSPSLSGNLNPRDYPGHFYPEPRVKLGRILREKRLATAMIDLSDGLSTDLAHICEESGVGAEIESALIPRAYVGKPRREVDLDLALDGGEDYELLFTAPPGKRVPSQIARVPLTCIGRITRSRKVSLRTAEGTRSELAPHGWEHFRN
jgi:thiamine-monophosphate kinase